MAGFSGRAPSDKGVKEVLSHIREGYLGGVVFFGRNLTNAKQIRKLTGLLKDETAEFVPFLAIDEEGGKVERLIPGNGFKRQPRANVIVSRGPKAARAIYEGMASEIADAGFNFNLGPVVDLNLRPSNPVIGKLGRSYGKDPEVVAEYAEIFIKAHRSKSIATALKHFPGHGSSRKDSHVSLVDVTGDWQREELIPYRELTSDKLADAVMTGHLINREIWSSTNLPATLSGEAVTMLRDELKYDGVVISDDLQMKGIAKRHPLAQAIVLALAAGNDIVLIGNVLVHQPETAKFAVRTIEEAVANGDLDRSKLEASYCRVIQLKKRLFEPG